MYFAVIAVTPLENYKLSLKFKNGEDRIFDMTPYLETCIFKELKDQVLFKTVRVSFDTVEWANEADIDPETLYKDSVVMQTA